MKTEYSKCPNCKRDILTHLGIYYPSNLVMCKFCSLVFFKIIPDAEELKEHYNNYPRGSVTDLILKRYNELLDSFEKFRKNNNIMDIGCGDGFFLMEAQKRGWNVFGIEVSESSVDVCRKMNITMFSEFNVNHIGNEIFDVITMFEVIEHLQNPFQFIPSVYSLLRKGGVLYLTTPNFNSLTRRILKSEWSVIDYLEHLFYFTPKSLHYLLSVNGFQKIYLKTTGVLIRGRKKNLGETICSTGDTRRIAQKIESNKFLLFLKKLANFFLSLFRVGDSLKVLYLKN